MSEEDISRMSRAETIAAMVAARTAMRLPNLTEEQRAQLQQQFEAMAEHLRDAPRDRK